MVYDYIIPGGVCNVVPVAFKDVTVDEKLSIIGNEYDIPIEENMRKDVSAMCNLGEGIEEKGIAKEVKAIIAGRI